MYEEERYGGRRPGRRRYDEPEHAVRKDKVREKPKNEKRKREEDKHAVMSRDKKKNGKKKSRGKKVLAVLAVLLVLFGVVWYLAIGSIYGKMRYSRVETLAGEPLKENGVVNILLIGRDVYKRQLYLLRGNRKNQCIFAPLLFLGSFLLDVPLGLRTGASVTASLSICLLYTSRCV